MANEDNRSTAPIMIPDNAPLVPEWAREAVRRLNMLTSATVATTTDAGGFGYRAIAFGEGNAALLLPGGFTGTVQLANLSVGGDKGWITVRSGQIVSVTQPK